MKTKLIAYSKFNLFLNVLNFSSQHKKHEISSIFMLSKQYFDTITISQSKDILDLQIKYLDKNNKQLNISDCIIQKTINFLENKYQKKVAAKIVIKKQIPVGSGLGGGSSDAAKIIEWFYRRYQIKSNQQVSYKDIALKLGSDIPFFLSRCKSAWVTGFGDKISPLKLCEIEHRIIINKVKCDTKKIFERYRKEKRTDIPYQNDLMPVVFKIYPQLHQEYLKLKQKHANLLMSGSGSAFVVLNKREIKND